MTTTESAIENDLLAKLGELKYVYRDDIRDRASLERNFRLKFESLNRVTLSENEFLRLLEQIVTPDVFGAARTLRAYNSFERDDGTPFTYSLVNIKDWCKNTFEVVNQLRMNTDNSHHRYDVMLLINGVPVVQIELKALAVSPRRAMQQIVDYKNDPGNGYGKALLCFIQLFVVSNRTDTNRVLNDTKPYGNVLDFRQQQDAVDKAIALFSGEGANVDKAREIWLVDSAPKMIDKLKTAMKKLDDFM